MAGLDFPPGSLLADGKFRVIKEIGVGSFGKIYKGMELSSGREFAIKVEGKDAKYPQLSHEDALYRFVGGGPGIPYKWLYDDKSNWPYRILVLQLLGPSLEDCFNACGRQFTLKTVLMLADQMIRRLEYLHMRRWIHHDIKPENFLMGDKTSCRKQVYLIDFGLATNFRETFRRGGAHNPYREDCPFQGTARYASLNAHAGIQQSRRDDLEALGHILMYFLRGDLPWQGIAGLTKKQTYENLCLIKRNTSIESLCRGHPKEFAMYLNYCRKLEFDEMPDYLYLRSLFYNVMRENNFLWDLEFDWSSMDNEEIKAISNRIEIKQKAIQKREKDTNKKVRQ